MRGKPTAFIIVFDEAENNLIKHKINQLFTKINWMN